MIAPLFLALSLAAEPGDALYSKNEPSASADAKPASSLVAAVRSTAVGPAFDATLEPFYHGVASGDPLSDRVILWTRVTPRQDTSLQVEWVMSKNPSLSPVAASGFATTDKEKDYTVKIDAIGLQPATTYYYAFHALGRGSIIGRTRTAPAATTDRLRFAVTSCANYQAGYFNAYGRIAARADLDAVLMLGDYIYEYAEGEYGYNPLVPRGEEPKNETVTLADYRARYSFYKLDANLRRAHQQHPWIPVWDDHEFADDAWKDGAVNHQEGAEGTWKDRKEASARAYTEWMPIRENPAGRDHIYRKISYGGLADLFMIDSRILDRDKQVGSVLDPALQDTTRTMLGPEQFEWLAGGLASSKARWKLIGNQVMMAQTYPVKNLDSWEGYYPERNRLYGRIRKDSVENVVVLTGDIHSTWISDLVENPLDPFQYGPFAKHKPVGVEFVTPSITSDNLNESLKLPPRNSASLASESAFRGSNPQLWDVELDSHGYMLLDLDAKRAQGEWYFSDILKPDTSESFYRAWQTVDRSSRVSAVSGSSQPPNGPALAPDAPPAWAPTSASAAPQGGPHAEFLIVGDYRNPDGKRAGFRVMVAQKGELDLSVSDALGRVLYRQQYRPTAAGQYLLGFSTEALPRGPWLCELRMGGTRQTRKLML